MPSQLVRDVRDRITAEHRPLTTVERTLLLATILAPDDGQGRDAVDELRDAIGAGRRALASDAERATAQAAVRQLLSAARGVLEHVPELPPPVAEPPVRVGALPRWRADVDG